MAIKTISQFPSGIPTDNDYILFEQNGEGKSATIGDAVNTCTLTYEEIMATNADLTNKVSSASAEALKHIATLDLIWANASPSSEFAGQTLNIDLSAYKIIYITFVGNKVSPNESYTMFIVDKNKGHMAIGWYGAKYSERLIRILNSTIVFGDAKYISSSTSATDNGYLVPFKIYGVK